jgi:fibronectin type 3 domain-containing protein
MMTMTFRLPSFRNLSLGLALGATLLWGPSKAWAGEGTSGADFVKIGVGARPSAMGEAYVAAADDINAAYWNPAGLALMDRTQVSLMHLAYLADISYENIAVGGPINRLSGWAANVSYLWQPPFDSTQNDFGAPTQAAATASDLAVGLSYAYNLGNYRTSDFNISNISVGLTLKLIQRELSGYTANAIYGDFGVLAEILEGLRLGFMVQNAGTTLTFISVGEPAPLNLKLGLAWNLHFNDANSLQLVYDVNHPIDSSDPNYNRWLQNVGAEYWLFNTLALRGGYEFGYDLGGLTAGAGFKWADVAVDYAFVPYDVVGNTHRISLSYAFGSAVSRPDVSAPEPPQNLKGLAGDRLISLAWDKSPEKDVIGYNVYYSKKSGDGYVRTNEKPEPNKTSLEVRLRNDDTYYFVVTAVNAAGKESEFSSEVTLKPRAPAKPGAPQALKTEVQGRTVTLTWKSVDDKEVVGYNVYYTKEPGKNYRKLTKAAPLTDPECRLRGLTPGSPYYFVVTSVTKEGLESDYSAEAFARPQQDTVNDALPEGHQSKKPAQAVEDNDPI